MTQTQVQEAYDKYQKACSECDKLDIEHSAALLKAYELEIQLKQTEKRASRLWKTYKRYLKLHQI